MNFLVDKNVRFHADKNIFNVHEYLKPVYSTF